MQADKCADAHGDKIQKTFSNSVVVSHFHARLEIRSCNLSHGLQVETPAGAEQPGRDGDNICIRR